MSFKDKFIEYITADLPKYLGETLEMVFFTALLALVFGLFLGLILYYTKNSTKKGVRGLYKVLDIFIGIVRSFPFYVLMFFVIPFTRIVMKVFTGQAIAFSTEAFIVPLTLAAIPFFGKLIENSLNEIDKSVIEAGIALGLNKWQITTKIILKEALPSIINGITLAIITLIGYSAMAGAVGGGGLGFFAYDKGYVAYDFTMMIFAVITIILLVLIIQQIGNLLYKLAKNGKLAFPKIFIGLGIIILIFSTIKIVNIFVVNNYEIINVGTMSQPGEPILKFANEELKKQGYKIEIKLYNGFDALNESLVDRSIDANLFQHQPFLDNYNKEKNTNLFTATTMYDCVYGAYSKKINTKEDIKKYQKGVIAVADDASNLKRCIDLLTAEGIIETTDLYKNASSINATDINKYYNSINGYDVILKTMATASIAPALDDENTILGIVNATFAINAKLTSEELIFEEEDKEHINANILAIRPEDKEEEWVEVLVDVLTSDNIKEFILNEFKGTIKPYFNKYI